MSVPNKLDTDSGSNAADIAANRRMVRLLLERAESGATMAELHETSGFRSRPSKLWIRTLATRNHLTLEMPKGDGGVTRYVAMPAQAEDEQAA